MKRLTITISALFIALFSFVGEFAAQTQPLVSSQQSKQQVSNLVKGLPADEIAMHVRPLNLGKKRLYFPRTEPLLAAEPSKENKQFYAFMVYSDLWGAVDPSNTEPGFYTFYDDPEIGIKKMYEIVGTPPANYAGVYVDGKFYAFYIDIAQFGTWISHKMGVYDTKTWKCERMIDDLGYRNDRVPIAMTYDMKTKTVYAISYTMDGSSVVLSTVNLQTGDFKPIGPCIKMAALAADGYGQLWGIGEDCYLYKINKSSGQTTQIGKVYDINPKYAQSATFDYETGKLYWAASLYELIEGNAYAYGDLVEVNLETGKGTQLYRFTGGEEFTGLWMDNYLPETPGRINNLHFEFTSPGASDGKIKFTAPITTYDLKTLTGKISLSIRIDDKEVDKVENVNPGYQYTSNKLYNFDDEKIHVISVIPSNATGRGPETSKKVFGGNDVPVGPSNVVLSTNDKGESLLTWEAPTEGVNGGYINPVLVNYKIVRWPDKITVASNYKETSFKEKINKDKELFFYQVISYTENKEGKYTISNKMILGNPCKIPYSQSFETPASLNPYTIIDVNGDAEEDADFSRFRYTWQFDDTYHGLLSYCHWEHNTDDWLITPALDIKPDKVYKFTFPVSGYSGRKPIKLKVTVGNAPAIEAQKTVLWDKNFISPAMNDPMICTIVFRTKEDKPQHIGLHSYSDAYTDHTQIRYIYLEESGTVQAPDSISNLKITPAEKGEYKAKLEFTTPSKDIEGNPLTELTAIKVFRGNQTTITPYATIKNPGIGKKITWTDEYAIQGKTLYRLVAGNSHGDGFIVGDSVFVGQDIPLPVTNVKVKCVDNTDAIITWEAPTGNVGVNGKYVDPSKLKYAIYRDISGQGVTLIANNVKECEYRDYNANTTNVEQAFISYHVSAVSPEGESRSVLSNNALVGHSFSLPYSESFAEGHVTKGVWLTNVITPGGPLWWSRSRGENPDAQPQDNDEGLTTFIGSESYQHGKSRHVSPRITLSETDSPVLSFYMYHVNEEYAEHDTLQIEIGSDEFDYRPIGKPIILKDKTTGWKKHEIPLDDYKNMDRVSISFKGIAGSVLYNIHVDNINITGTPYDYELKAVSLTGPKECLTGESNTYTVTIKNLGSKDNGNFKIELYRDDRLIDTHSVTSIAAGTTETYGFNYTASLFEADENHTMYAKIVATQDKNSVNNQTPALVSYVKAPNFPYITDLTGEVTEEQNGTYGNVTLNWSEPFKTPYPNMKTDDLESYEAFAITNVGDWTLVDLDHARPYRISDGQGGFIEWPHCSEPQAFIVFNPTKASINSTGATPYSGKQCFVSFAAAGAQNNDWLISPLLSRNEQIVSFYAKRLQATYQEEFYLCVSATDTKPESFTRLTQEPTIASSAWQEYTYTLPAGTKYFAINYVSNNKFGLMIDDITFERPLEVVDLLGYNVYRNHYKMNDEPLGNNEFFDKINMASGYIYRVSAVYEQGESILSQPTEKFGKGSGIEMTTLNEIIISSFDKHISITNNTRGKQIFIYSIDGKLIKTYIGETDTLIPMREGLYLVKVGNQITKIAVK